MILGLYSFEKLVELYGEQGARNLASLARSKLILATADLDTAEQCARYIGNRELRQTDEAYSYGYNNNRDASTLTPRKQVARTIQLPMENPAAKRLRKRTRLTRKTTLSMSAHPLIAVGHSLSSDSSPEN